MITDQMVKDAATEYLSHKGERPYRVLRGGQELWETHAEAMRAALTAALGDAVVVPPDAVLVQRCKELLEWSKTGLLNGGSGGSVRELADEWRGKIGDIHALSVAESQVRDDAMREVIHLAEALAVTRHGRGATTDGVA